MYFYLKTKFNIYISKTIRFFEFHHIYYLKEVNFMVKGHYFDKEKFLDMNEYYYSSVINFSFLEMLLIQLTEKVEY